MKKSYTESEMYYPRMMDEECEIRTDVFLIIELIIVVIY